MFTYFAYGLTIRSELPIPEFLPTQAEPDVTLHIQKNSAPHTYLPAEAIAQPWCILVKPEEIIFYLKDTATFLIQSGQKVVVVPADGTSEQMLRLYITGLIMAIVLYQRGLLVLHASVVDIHRGAVAFLGESGQGKSSTAAMFCTYGHGFLADDVAGVTLGQECAAIASGFPQIKLSQEVALALGYDFDTLLELHPLEPKRGYRLERGFLQVPRPIRRIYVLSNANELAIEPLNYREAVIELARHSRPTTLGFSGGASHFYQCAALAKECGVYRLSRPRDLTVLPDLVPLVEKDVLGVVQPIMV